MQSHVAWLDLFLATKSMRLRMALTTRLHSSMIWKMVGLSIPLIMVTDSKCLFDIVTRTSVTKERLLIDIAVVKNAYAKNEIFQVGHVFSDQNPAYAMTKVGNFPALNSVLESSYLSLGVNQWVERKEVTKNVSKERNGSA